MKDLVTLFKNWRNSRRQKALSNKLKEIRNTFEVKERKGMLFLMCDGIPYKIIHNGLSAGEINDLLLEARMSMRIYFGFKADGTI